MSTPLDPLSLPPVPEPAQATHPQRDRIVATLFALALAMPLMALTLTWSRTMTLFEKRPMAPWPAIELAISFPPAFERAFADRFGGRDALIRWHHALLLESFGVSALATVMPGRDGWYYWLGEDGLSLDRHYRGVADFPDSYVDATVAELIRRHDWLAKAVRALNVRWLIERGSVPIQRRGWRRGPRGRRRPGWCFKHRWGNRRCDPWRRFRLLGFGWLADAFQQILVPVIR